MGKTMVLIILFLKKGFGHGGVLLLSTNTLRWNVSAGVHQMEGGAILRSTVRV